MLTTEDIFNIDDFNFTDSYNFNEHDDILQQLSVDLNIPSLLDQNQNGSDDDLLSEIMNAETWTPNIDLLHFPIPESTSTTPEQVSIKQELSSSPTESIKSVSPTPSQSSDENNLSSNKYWSVCLETPPVSPEQKPTITTTTTQPRVTILPTTKRKLLPNTTNSNPKVVVLQNAPTCVVPLHVQTVPVLYTQAPDLDLDTRALKRQLRKIKNRESACLSLKRKKDYLMALEKEVAELRIENQRLRQENANLCERLLGHKFNGFSIPLPNKINKNTAFLLAILFMVSINVGSIRGLFNLNQQFESDLSSPLIAPNSGHLTRNLLWNPPNADVLDEPIATNESSSTDCPMQYVNQSESVRLARELHRWIAKPFNSTTSNKKPQRKRIVRKHSNLDVPLFGNRKPNRYYKKLEGELQVFQPRLETIYAEFFEAINRRDDTFYVVSFNTDNMLLPALHHNNTRRPKMSLLLPALLPNETMPDNNSTLSLFQIDCEVIDTRLLHVESRSIPEYLRASGNYTTRNEYRSGNVSAAEQTGDNEEFYKPYFIRNESFKPHIQKFYEKKHKKMIDQK